MMDSLELFVEGKIEVTGNGDGVGYLVELEFVALGVAADMDDGLEIYDVGAMTAEEDRPRGECGFCSFKCGAKDLNGGVAIEQVSDADVIVSSFYIPNVGWREDGLFVTVIAGECDKVCRGGWRNGGGYGFRVWRWPIEWEYGYRWWCGEECGGVYG